AIVAALGLRISDQATSNQEPPENIGTEYGDNPGSDHQPVRVRVKKKRLSEEEALNLIEVARRVRDPIALANARAELVDALYSQGRFKRALQIGEDTLKSQGLSDLKRGELQMTMGEIYAAMGQPDKSCEVFQTVFTNAPAKYLRDAAARPLITW